MCNSVADEFKGLLIEAVEKLKKNQESNYSGRYDNDEIPESNLSHHLAATLINKEYYIAPEYPLPLGARLDMAAYSYNAEPTPWITAEFKRHVHSNTGLVLADLKRLDNIKNGDLGNKTDSTPIIKCFAVFNRFPRISDWWKSRGDKAIDDVSAIKKGNHDARKEYKEIEKYLKNPGAQVGGIEWYPSENNDWVYEVLYVIWEN